MIMERDVPRGANVIRSHVVYKEKLGRTARIS